nr:hypothetical protein GCM10025730_01850 [Promicromonospora thailandica]
MTGAASGCDVSAAGDLREVGVRLQREPRVQVGVAVLARAGDDAQRVGGRVGRQHVLGRCERPEPGGDAVQHLLQVLLEPGAGGDVVLVALQGVQGHGPCAQHRGDAPVEVGHVGGELPSPVGDVGVEHGADLLQAQARDLVAQDEADPHRLPLAVPPVAGLVALGLQEAHLLPVPQHVGVQPEPGGGLADACLHAHMKAHAPGCRQRHLIS